MDFELTELTRSSVLHLHGLRKSIRLDPPYQRMGEIWNLEKRQLLVDSIINGFDIPKIYFHNTSYKSKKYRYAIIDGRQRLETIWGFIGGKFALSDEFKFISDPTVKANGLTYRELAEVHPYVRQEFDASSLSVFVINTEDEDLIEEMFTRLNEAVPLNAAEKRNAFGGPLPKIIREIAVHRFFERKICVSNRRYQHRDLAAKLLWLSHNDGRADTKKVYLDEFVRNNKDAALVDFDKIVSEVNEILGFMTESFVDSDPLLRSSGLIVVYFLIFRNLTPLSPKRQIMHQVLESFEKDRKHNRKVAEKNLAKANYSYLEFDRLMQTPNDAYAIRLREEILNNYIQGA